MLEGRGRVRAMVQLEPGTGLSKLGDLVRVCLAPGSRADGDTLNFVEAEGCLLVRDLEASTVALPESIGELYEIPLLEVRDSAGKVLRRRQAHVLVE